MQQKGKWITGKKAGFLRWESQQKRKRELNMERYTFIAEYRGGTYTSQYDVENLEDGLKLWAENLDLKYFSKSKKEKIIAETKDRDLFPVELDGIKNTWCASYLRGKFELLLNIVKTAID